LLEKGLDRNFLHDFGLAGPREEKNLNA